MNLEDFRGRTANRDGKDELVITVPPGLTCELKRVVVCLNDPVVLLQCETVKTEVEPPKVQVIVDKAQLDFLIWSLGYIYGAADNMDDAHKAFIGLHHGQLLPILTNAKDHGQQV